MMRNIGAILICCFSVITWGQSAINYQYNSLQKELQKELQKAGITDFSTVKELTIVDSVKQKNRIQGKFFEIQSDISQYQYIYTGKVNTCRAGGCSISEEIPNDSKSEYFDYFILFDKNKTVQLVKIFNYQATHGQEITSKGWLKQFIGHDGSEPLQVDKNIDAISGATVSVHALTFDVALITKIIKSL